MAGVDAGRAQVHHAAGIRGRDDRAGLVGAGAVERGDLAVTDLAGELGLRDGVRAAGTAAEAFVVGVPQVVGRAEHGAHRSVGPLDVAQVARILDDDGAVLAAVGGTPAATSHSEKSLTRAANAWASGVSSKWPYSFMLAPQPALLTTIGASPGIDAMTRRASCAGLGRRGRRGRGARRNTTLAPADGRRGRRWRA